MTQKVQKIEAEPMWNYMYLTVNKKANVSKSGLIVSTIDVIDMKQDVLKVGDGVRTIRPGYSVEVDPRPYFVKDWKDQNNPSLNEEIHKKNVVSIAWPIEEKDGVDVMVVPDSHIRTFWRNGIAPADNGINSFNEINTLTGLLAELNKTADPLAEKVKEKLSKLI